MVGRDHLLQNVDDLVVVVPGRVLEPLQVGVEFFQIDLHGRRDEDFVVGGFGHLVLLGVHEQFLVQLFAGAQTSDLDLHIYARLVAVEAYQAVGQIHDLDRLTHVQHVDAAALRQTAGLQNELRSLGDGHKVADNIGMRDSYRPPRLICSSNSGMTLPWCPARCRSAPQRRSSTWLGEGLDQHLAQTLGAAHDVRRVDSLVCRELDEPLHAVLSGGGQQVLGAKDVVLDGLGGADLHQRHMLVRRRVKDDGRLIGVEHLVQTCFIADGADEGDNRSLGAVLVFSSVSSS